MKKLAFIVLFINSFITFGQGDFSVKNSIPTNYFDNPMDIPMVLSGTFGELRSNHFHAGLDIKTKQREGIDVFASAEGYVSRIKISLWGYGKAIYITHPNGYTTVYAHLKKFNEKIENYIKKHQYKTESFEVQVFPSKDELPISKNELIALSGSTGGFVGPHLHFEIRDSKTEKPMNPFLFGIDAKDGIKPRISTLIGYSLDSVSQINKLNSPIQLSFIKSKNGDLLAKRIFAYGKIGFGVNTYDQLDAASNKNGIYSLQMNVNGEKVHEFIASSFSFSETKLINLAIDYDRFANLNQRIQKCYNEPKNNLSLYNTSINNGILTIEDGLSYTVEIIAKDFKGNEQKISIHITGKKDEIIETADNKTTPFKIKSSEFNVFYLEGYKVAFPKNTFYSDFYMDLEVKDDAIKVHQPTEPVRRKYTLTFNVSKYSDEEKNQLYIASISKNGKTKYESTVKKKETFYTSTKTLGKFTLVKDSEKPTIKLHNFKNEQWVTNFNTLQVKISDKDSGIKSFRAEIDGEWVLMELDLPSGILSYNLSDKNFSTAKHILKIVVIDNVGNLNSLNTTFFRKK